MSAYIWHRAKLIIENSKNRKIDSTKQFRFTTANKKGNYKVKQLLEYISKT